MTAPAPDYRVKTKAEQVRGHLDGIETGDGGSIPLVSFMVAAFATDCLSRAQREVLAELATWEGVRVEVMAGHRRGRRIHRLYIHLKGRFWHSSSINLRVGVRGGLSGSKHTPTLGSRELEPSGHGWPHDLGTIAMFVDELGDWRAMSRRLRAHKRAEGAKAS